MFVLDTNVVSELRKVRLGKADPHVARWADRVDTAALFLSVVTILELEIGVLRIERRDKAQSTVFRSWLDDQVIPTFSGRILPVDIAVMQHCARLQVPDPRPERDALIAATAIVHGMTIVTRNISDFRTMAVALINPWAPV